MSLPGYHSRIFALRKMFQYPTMMMRRTFYRGVSLFLLCGLLLAGCDDRDATTKEPSGETSDGSISFHTTDSFSTKSLSKSDWKTVDVPMSDCLQEVPSERSSVLTRGTPVLGTDAPVGSFGVLGYLLPDGVWDAATATPSFMYNTQVTRSGSSGSYLFSYSPVKYWPASTSDLVRFFAYYPYNGEGISLSSQTATGYPAITYTPSTTVSNQVDLMYAYSAGVNNKTTGTAVSLAFAHTLTRVSFSVKLASTYTTEKILVQSIQMTGLKSSGTLSLDPSATSPWTLGSTTASYTASVSDGSLIPTANQALSTSGYLSMTSPNGYLLLPPQSVTSSNTLVVSYTVDGVAIKATYTLSAATWSMGQSINYQLTLPLPTANCYIIAPSASKTINVGVMGNGGSVASTGLSTSLSPSTVAVLWQTSSGLVTVGTYNSTSKTVTLTASSSSGNAVVAAYDASSNILWSWHIWVTSYDPNTPSNGTTYTYSNGTTSNVWMDRNLGATSVAVADVNTLGLLYQWGRKDPFVNADAYSGSTTALSVTGTAITKTSGATTLANSILHPTYYYYTSTSPYDWNSSPNTDLWGGAAYGAAKTIFDPCPTGWRVPSFYKTSSSVSPFYGLAFYATAATYWSTNGYQWTTTPGIGFWPAAGYRNSSSGSLLVVGSYGDYWSASPYSNYGYYQTFLSGSQFPASYGRRAYGYSVRCVQEW
jgi:uncharacterized protein (TIGR02145 family)